MSYARFSYGDVYVFASGDQIVCCGCKLGEDVVTDRAGMLKHLQQHRDAGHDVPEEALERLRWELKHKQSVFGRVLNGDEN